MSNRPPTDPKLIAQIADRLSRPIPAPAKPPARTRQSWQTLKVGQKLRLRTRWFRDGTHFPEGTLLTVSKTDSQGISLTIDSTSGIIRWTNVDWKPVFEKVKKERTRK